ncbi:MAG TPA: tRNA (guanosine(46)-N7)-methyltransferase TrmB [Gammaproteobacteria bacterium]|nr:tRNA (guanosine(46)-N7)-methyltransferase TrmB [Gammaproteobacteria bacterium]
MNSPRRRIRSFVRREGRFTPGQRRAFDTLWPGYGIDPAPGFLDFDALFGRRAPRVLEIGFGNGDNLLHMAACEPDTDFLGIEVYRPGVGRLFHHLRERDIRNVRVICDDAVAALQQRIPDASLDKVLLFFPDPWPKKRHHKRRLVQTAFVELVGKKLKPGGCFHVATDWEEYAEHVLALMAGAPGFLNLAGSARYAKRPPYRVCTKFEQRGQRLGHVIRDLLFRKT